MSMSEWLSCLLIAGGGFFFLAGSVGLLRFPDVFVRLHALTKADNLGLGFTIAGLMLQTSSLSLAATYLFIWVLVLASSATICCLIANTMLQKIHRSEPPDDAVV